MQTSSRSYCALRSLVSGFVAAAAILGSFPAQAGDITGSSIVPIPQHVTGSGNGTLDWRLFTYSGSEIQNTAGLFNGDNGNNTLPQGGGADTLSFSESFVTTAGELKAYMNLNFGVGAIHELMIMLDLNETGGGQAFNTLAKLDIVLNPTTMQGNPNPAGDVSSAGQAGIDQIFTGGSLLARLNPQPAANLPVNSQGAGFADYAILTGIDPYALNDSDVLLFNISMDTLNNGAEEIFLSGLYSPADIVVPEPNTFAIIALGGIGLALWRTRRRPAIH